MKLYGGIYRHNIGNFGIINDMFSLLELRFLGESQEISSRIISDTRQLKENDVTKKVYENLECYFSGKEICYDVPLMPSGAEFFKKVWLNLQDIPYGQTRSYKDIAKAIHFPKSSRAVGVANHKNPILIFIPCHRVIGSNKKLVGYACGLDLKVKLLEIEGIKVDKERLFVQSHANDKKCIGYRI